MARLTQESVLSVAAAAAGSSAHECRTVAYNPQSKRLQPSTPAVVSVLTRLLLHPCPTCAHEQGLLPAAASVPAVLLDGQPVSIRRRHGHTPTTAAGTWPWPTGPAQKSGARRVNVLSEYRADCLCVCLCVTWDCVQQGALCVLVPAMSAVPVPSVAGMSHHGCMVVRTSNKGTGTADIAVWEPKGSGCAVRMLCLCARPVTLLKQSSVALQPVMY